MPQTYQLRVAEVAAEQFLPKAGANDGDVFRAFDLNWRIRVDGLGTYCLLGLPAGRQLIIRPTDWIIKNSLGEFDSLNDATFQAQYQRADPAP